MSNERYLIEIQNVSKALVVLTCPAKSPIMLTPALHDEPAKLALTGEQFLSMAYDLEGFAEGKHGVPKQLRLYVTDRETGEVYRASFEEAHLVASGGLSADSAAVSAQDAQAAALEAERQKILAANKPADTSSLAGAVGSSIAQL